MTPHSEDLQIWKIPPNTRLNFKFGSRECLCSSYSVVYEGTSALSSPVHGGNFAPSLHALKRRLDAVLKQAAGSSNPESAHAGSKRKFDLPQEDLPPPPDGATSSVKLKSSMITQRTFRTTAVRTSTQRRVLFLPETRVDEYVIETSSSQEHSDELIFPPAKKNKVGFGGSEVTPATGAESRNPHQCYSMHGEEEILNREEEHSKTSGPNSSFATLKRVKIFDHVKGAGTAEPNADCRFRRSDGTGEANSDRLSSSGTKESTGDGCEVKTNESRYGTLPVNLKRPKLVTSLETPNKRGRRNADQTIPGFGPTAGYGCAGPAPEPNELQGTTRTRVAPYSDTSPRPQKASLFEDSLVEDSQEDNGVEDSPVLPTKSEHAVTFKGGGYHAKGNDKRSATAERPYNLTRDNEIKILSNVEEAQYKKHPEIGRLDSNCRSDARLYSREYTVIGSGVQAVSWAESVTSPRANLLSGDSWPQSVSRVETGVRLRANEKCDTHSPTSISGLSVHATRDEGWRRPARHMNSEPAECHDGSGKCPGQDVLSNVFRTGRGNPVQLSPSALNRVMSLFDDDITLPVTTADISVKQVPRVKPLVVSSTLADAQSLLSVRKNVYTHSLSFPEPDRPKNSDLDAIYGLSIGGNAACLFQTGSGKRVHISAESMRKVHSMLPETDTSIKPGTSARGQSSHPIRAREEVPNSGDDKLTNRDLHDVGANSVIGSLSRSSQFRTGRDTPVSISSAALRRIQSIFEDDEIQIEAENSRSGSKRSSGGESVSHSRYEVERNCDPRLDSDGEARTIRESYQPSSFEAARSTRRNIQEGTNKETSYTANPLRIVQKDSSPGAGDWSFSFKGSSGRTLRVSSAAKAKAEALLKLGPEFVTPPRFETSRPSSEFSAKASELRGPLLFDGEKRRGSACGIRDARKYVNNTEPRKITRTDFGGERGTKSGFKSPRLVRPTPGLDEGQSYVGVQSDGDSASRRNYLLPVSLRYIHNKISRNERGRLSMLEYFGGPPCPEKQALSHLSKEVLSVTADTAESYRIPDGLSGVGVEDIWMMLKELGADQRYASQGWVTNHFRWIVWKLASYERKFPHQHARLLTLSSVLNELKYRYDRELNGERSALKRVTERDASASQTMVLCVSAVRSLKDVDHFYEIWTDRGDNMDGTKRKPPSAGIVELTDGWYRLNAHIDVPLASRIHMGKLKAGQKIVVCGAILDGLSDAQPPLQAYQNAYLCINSNGVRRARWDQRLGFCGTATPLAFKCITQDGGLIPHTYVAITRRYPLLYREKLAGGGYILRSDRAEDRAAHDFDRRRAKAAEEAMERVECPVGATHEGAKLFAALETASDPESLLLDMTRAQLDAFAAYKARREESVQTAAGEVIKTALELQGLATREVTPTFRVRVVGLNREEDTESYKDGLVTIWQATEELQEQLQEGKVFCVYGLRPSSKGSYHSFNSTRWRAVSSAALENKYKFAYVPRTPLRISNLSEYMSCREFDVAGLVLLVTDPVTRDVFRGIAKFQWVFMTDGSCAKGDAADAWEETQVLAVEVSWPEEAFVPVDTSLVGSVVGYCNLWLKHRDHSNRLWVAEASDRALYSTKMTSPAFRHLKGAACNVEKWAKLNSWNVDILQSDVEELAVHFKTSSPP